MPRTKGTPNRITASTKELLSDVIEGEADRIQEALSEVFESNKKDYLLIMSAIFGLNAALVLANWPHYKGLLDA